MIHPLLDVLLAAAAGTFPPADGQVIHLPPLPRGQQAVVSLTGRAYLATIEPIAGLDGFGSALHPAVLQRIAGPGGDIGTLDLTLVATGRGGGALPPRHDRDDHPRVRHARGLRDDVRVHGDHRGLVTLACGLAGRTELSVEATIPGSGPALIDDPPNVDDDGAERSPSMSRERIEADLDEIVEGAARLVERRLDYDTALRDYATKLLPLVGGDPTLLWSTDNVLSDALT